MHHNDPTVQPPAGVRQAMHFPSIPRDRLLGILRENLERHKQEYAEAMKGWREKVRLVIAQGQKTLAEYAEDAQGEDFVPAGFHYFLQVPPVPESHADDYADAIALLEMETTEVIYLNRQDFLRYVRDQWDWQDQFKSLVNSYTVGEG